MDVQGAGVHVQGDTLEDKGQSIYTDHLRSQVDVSLGAN